MAVANLAKPQEDHVARIARFAIDIVKVANTIPIMVSSGTCIIMGLEALVSIYNIRLRKHAVAKLRQCGRVPTD